MTQEAKGLFVPYPLLGIIVTLCLVLIGGIVTLKVEVSNLSTTILLRDADSRAATQALQEKLSTLEVYVHNDRERLIRLEAQDDKNKRR